MKTGQESSVISLLQQPLVFMSVFAGHVQYVGVKTLERI